MPYLTGRGVTREQAEAFGLGLCTTGKTIPGRVGIPIHNADGQLVAYAGRWVGAPDDIPEGEEKYKLPAGFHKSAELYNLHRVKACQTLVVVEGYFGTIRLFGGLRVPTVGLMGASVSDRQIALLKEHCPALRFVTVCLDGDEPGRKAGETVAARLAPHWWVRIAKLARRHAAGHGAAGGRAGHARSDAVGWSIDPSTSRHGPASAGLFLGAQDRWR